MNTTTLRRQVHLRTLDNGSRIGAIHDPTARNVCVVLSVPAGMRHEIPGQEGMFHLLEHMVYQDSEQITAARRQSEIQRAGGVLGGHTHMDYSEFYETAAVGHLGEMARRLVDQVFHPVFDAAQISAQIQAVARERAQRLAGAPGQALPWPHLLPQCWEEYSHAHDGSGDADLAERASAARLRELHSRHYHLAQCVLVALGPHPAEQMLQDLSEALLSETAAGSRIEPPPPPQPAAFRESSYRRIAADSLTRTRLLAATRSAPAQQVTEALVGDHLVAAGLSLQPGLDASAGMFGVGDLPTDDLFIVVDDTGQGIEPAARFSALPALDPAMLRQAAQRALFTAERLVHDDERRARATARDLLLRGDAQFTDQLTAALAAACTDRKRREELLAAAATRLGSQPMHHLSITPASQEAP